MHLNKYITGYLPAVFLMLSAAYGECDASETRYVSATEPTGWWGTGKTETYDVATHIGTEFGNPELTAISFHVRDDREISDFSIWLSTDLILDSENVNSPDIMKMPAEASDGIIRVELKEPYTVGNDGVYIGYSFTVGSKDTQEQKKPVAIAAIANKGDNHLYIHTSRTYAKWKTDVAGANAIVPFELELQGVPAVSLDLSLPDEINAAANRDITTTATITNLGASGASTLRLKWNEGDMEDETEVALDSALPTDFGASLSFPLKLPPLAEIGEYPLIVELISADGADNESGNRSAVANINVYSFLPAHRPLVEEYTGTGCGYCPRGAVAFENMKALHSDEFVGISYHHSDVMSVLIPDDYPNPAPAQPVAWVDRHFKTDPYFGTETDSYSFGFDKVWKELASEFTPADLKVDCKWTDDAGSAIEVSSAITFVKPFENADYKIVYMLVADGLHGEGPKWMQNNYYSGSTGNVPDDLRFLTEAKNPMAGVTYNDVVILCPDPLGTRNSLPASIGRDETIEHSATLTLKDAVNISGEALTMDGLKYSVVAAVVDSESSNVINSVKQTMPDPSGVWATTADSASTTVCYDITGNRLPAAPPKGLYIEVRTDADGHCKATKRCK